MSNHRILILTLGLNGLYMAALFTFMASRILLGLSPMPEGYGPLVIGSAVIVPLVCIGVGNLLRLRRNT